MKHPSESLVALIEQWAHSTMCFAFCRLPGSDDPLLLIQQEGEAEELFALNELDGKSGFVFAPFQATRVHPIILFHPDHKAAGWEAIEACARAVPQVCRHHSADNPPSSETPLEGKAAYEEAFKRFIVALRQGRFSKLVLARKAVHTLPDGFKLLEAFQQACESYPRMFVSLCYTPRTGVWMGSTPEIMLSGSGKDWQTVSLAGTLPMEGDALPTGWGMKNREEQAFVSDYIRRELQAFGTIPEEYGPYVVRAGQVAHLKTEFHFRIEDNSHLGGLLNRLYPTPAVCGLPKEEARCFISETEHCERSYYSGLVGWIDPMEDTRLYVNLRCMHLAGQQATLYAGGGILPSSVEENEWKETCHKMRTMEALLLQRAPSCRPSGNQDNL